MTVFDYVMAFVLGLGLASNRVVFYTLRALGERRRAR
jgi:hypothetical protein